MENYNELEESLALYKLSPAVVDAVAWARIIGGLGSFEDDKNYLKHFLESDEEVIYDFFINRIANNNSLLEEDELSLLLPDDDSDMELRLQALSSWCDTFISSLGCSEHLKNKGFTTKIDPFLRDLAEISKVDTTNSSDDYNNIEETEIAFMELYEFVRVTIISLDIEFKTFATQ